MEDFTSGKNRKGDSGTKTLIIAGCITAVLLLAGGVGVITMNTKETGMSYQNEQANASLAVVEDEVESYIEKYFTNTGVKQFISEEDMAEIVKLVSDGVISLYGNDSFSSNEKEIIREMIANAVTEAVTNFNKTIKDQTLVDQSVVTTDFKNYINETMLPGINKTIQSNTTDIADLKIKLEELSYLYNQQGVSNDAMIKNILEKINASSSKYDSLQDEINTNKENQSLTNNQLTNADSNLQSQIDSNKETTNLEIADIKNELAARATDAWIGDFTIEASEFVYDGAGFSYTINNENFKADSEVLIAYAQGTKITVSDYYQADGVLTITLKKAPKDPVMVDSIHIINK